MNNQHSFVDITFFTSCFSVGYDDRRMVLDGEFSYDDQNQRALPFNVAIQELSEEMTLYVGSKSKSVNNFFFNDKSESQPKI